MTDVIYCEWRKLGHSKIITVGVWGTMIVPVLVMLYSIQRYLKNTTVPIALFDLYDSALMFLMLLFAPLVMSVIAIFLISREYAEHTLKTIFAVPVSRKKFLVGKFVILFLLVMLFCLMSWLEILLLACVCSLFMEVTQITAMSALFFLIKMLYGGVLLYMTISPIMYLVLRTKGYMIPFIVVACVCLLNVVLSNSPIAGFYPWTASYLLVSGRTGNSGCPSVISFLLIALLFILAVLGSARRFLREDIV